MCKSIEISRERKENTMEKRETMDVYEFCEWLFMYLHTHDSEYVSKAVISERLNNTEWVRMTAKGMKELNK